MNGDSSRIFRWLRWILSSLLPILLGLAAWLRIYPGDIIRTIGIPGCLFILALGVSLYAFARWPRLLTLIPLIATFLLTVVWIFAIPKPPISSAPEFEELYVENPLNCCKPGDTVRLWAKMNRKCRVWADFGRLDTESKKEIEFEDRVGGMYFVQYRISPDNKRPEGPYDIICEAQGKNTEMETDRYKVYYDPNPAVFEDIIPKKLYFRKKDVISLEVQLDEAVYDLKADFSAIDSTYFEGQEEFSVAAPRIYTITYPISPQNDISGGVYIIPITAVDQCGNKSRKKISLEYDPDPPIFTTEVTPRESNTFKNGDTVYLIAELDQIRYGLTADFVSIDSTYEAGDEKVNDNDDGTYTISYRIKPTNTREDDSYSIRITAFDRAGNSSFRDVDNLFLDNTPPEFLSSPSIDRDIYRNGDTVNLVAHLDAPGYTLIADFSRMDTLYSPARGKMIDCTDDKVDNNNNGSIDEDDERGYYYINYQVDKRNTAKSGKFRIIVLASDKVENVATDSIWVELDNIPPDAISIEKPRDGDCVSHGLSTFTIQDREMLDKDVENFILQIRSPELDYFDVPGQYHGDWHPGGSSSITWDTTTIVEGVYDFRVVVTDRVGNTFITPSVIGVQVDRSPPLIEDIIPKKLYFRKKDVISLEVQLDEAVYDLKADFSAIDSTYFEGQEEFSVAAPRIYTITYPISPQNDISGGVYIIPITAVDQCGNKSRKKISLEYDPDPPIFTTEVTPRESNTFKNGDTVYLIAELDQIRYGLTADFVSIDSTYEAGDEKVNDNDDGTYTISYRIKPTNTREDDSYSIRITAFDRAGNSSFRDVDNLFLDNTPPEFLSSPSIDRDIYRNGDTVNLVAHLDAPGYTLIADFSRMDTLYSPARGKMIDCTDDKVDNNNNGSIDEDDERGYYYINYQVDKRNTAKSGKFRIIVLASDKVENVATDSIWVELDNIPPDAISIEKPRDGDCVSHGLSTFTIQDREMLDKDVENFILQIRSPELDYFDVPGQYHGDWHPGGSSSITWDTTTIVEGVYDFRVVVTDRVGNTFITPSVIGVQVDRSPPLPPWHLLAIHVPEKGITLVWQAASQDNDIDKCRIYRSARSGEEQHSVCIVEVAANSTGVYTWIDLEVEAGNTYYYWVTAQDRCGNESVRSNRACPL